MAKATYRCNCCGGTDVERVRAPKTQPKVSAPPSKPNARSKMWQAMRVLRRFTAPDIAATSESEVKSARVYIVALQEAKYIRTVHVSSGEVGDFSVYQLVENTGPEAPRLRADGKAILDLNLNKEVPRVRGCR